MEPPVDAVIKKSSENAPITSGLVLTFIQEEFEGYKSRQGTESDVLNIRECFPPLGLTVMDPYINYPASEVISTLDGVSRSDLSEYGCLIVIIITHFFEVGKLLSKEGNYYEDDIIDFFKGDRCPGLIGKPKMFFFQASRCEVIQQAKIYGSRMDGTSTFVAKFTLPNEADIFTFRSSYEGGPSHKPENTGSWVIQKLCQRLKNLDGNISLLEAFTALLNDIKSNRSGETNAYTILPEITSSLLQKVFFINPSIDCASKPSSYKKGKNMGILYVFNYNHVFYPLTRTFLPREGTKIDTAYIKKCFGNLGFDVRVEHDLYKEELFKILREAPDFTNDTCVAVAILTHGIDGSLGTSDKTFNEQDLYDEFSPRKRPDLVGKPKIFFLQVCRGDRITPFSTVAYEKREENIKISMTGDDFKVESFISDEETHHSSMLIDGCEIYCKTAAVENECSFQGRGIETKLKTHTNVERFQDSHGDEKSDSVNIDTDYFATVTDSRDISTTHDVEKITSVNNTQEGVTIKRDVKNATTVRDIEGNVIFEMKESLTRAGNKEDITTADNFKSLIDDNNSICSTSYVSEESSCTVTGINSVGNTVIDTKHSTQIMDSNVETDARGPIAQTKEAGQGTSPESTAPKYIHPLEYEDTLVVHSTYAHTPSHREPKKGSWFIQGICEHLEKLTNTQEISLLDALFKVQKHIAEKRETIIEEKLHKQMPVISSTLTQCLMLGPSTTPNI